MSSIAPSTGFRLTGWHVLAGFVAFFGVTIAVDTVMMVDAYRTFPGEVSSTPYEDGLAFDSELDQQKSQAALGWRMSLGSAGAGVIDLTAKDRDGAPLTRLRIVARAERPATEQDRLNLQFRQVSAGVYQARTGALAGAWDVRLSAYDRRGRRFDAERRLISP